MAGEKCRFAGNGCCFEKHNTSLVAESGIRVFTIKGKRVIVNQALVADGTDLLPSGIWRTQLRPTDSLIDLYVKLAGTSDSQGYLPVAELINGEIVHTPFRADCPMRLKLHYESS